MKWLSLQQSGSLCLFCESSGIIVVIILLAARGYSDISSHLHFQASLLWTFLHLNLGNELRAHPCHHAVIRTHQSARHYLQEMLATPSMLLGSITHLPKDKVNTVFIQQLFAGDIVHT